MISTAHIREDTDLLSQRAEIFRSKLISDFHLLESISEGGIRMEVPRFYTHDLLDKSNMTQMIINQPQGLVRFQVYQDKETQLVTSAERKRNRLKNKNAKNPPLDLWANWIINSNWFQNSILALILINSVVLGIHAGNWFQNSILALILINSVVLGIHAELADKTGKEVELLILELFDYCALLVFVVEIFLKWLDNFWAFWKNRWNIFDFLVTFLSFVPEIIKYSTGGSEQGSPMELTVVADNLRTFRVLRSLKMVSRFQKVRLIVMAVTKAFQAMMFITVLMFIFLYIFAIIGVIFFDYSKSTEKLYYENSFKSIVNAMITLLQIFTLDHWLEVYKDVRSVVGGAFAALYVILWIIIGSFIFRNIFVGIMVNNFQSIRNELFQEVEEIRDRERRDREMVEFAEELERQNVRRESYEAHSQSSLAAKTQEGAMGADQPTSQTSFGTKLHTSLSRYQSAVELTEALSQHVNKSEQDSTDWQAKVERNLENLSREESTFCWPRDSLFRYFLMMEALQENLSERQEIINLAGEALLQIHDN